MERRNLSEYMFIILTLLLTEKNHGYGLLLKADELGFTLAHGSMYRNLSDLEEWGLIKMADNDVDDPRRKVYEITSVGSVVARSQLHIRKQLFQNLTSFVEGV